MRGERLAGRLAPREPLDLGGLRRRPLGRQFVLGRARLKLVELQFKLVEKPLFALRAPAVHLAPELLDRQLQEGDLRRGVGHLRLGVRGPRLGRREDLLQGCDVGPAGHRRDRITSADSPLRQSCRESHLAADQPARNGR